MTNSNDKHTKSHEAAVFGTEYTSDPSLINFDIVSIPNKDGMVTCPSEFCKNLLSDCMPKTDVNYKKKQLASLHADMKKKVDEEPMKLCGTAKDYLIAFMEIHNVSNAKFRILCRRFALRATSH